MIGNNTWIFIIMLTTMGTVLISQSLTINNSEVFAHRSGCHAAHSCPSDTGSYVCGDTGHYSQCPGKNHKSSNSDDHKTTKSKDKTDKVKDFEVFSAKNCRGKADCFEGIVTEVVDGDTLDVNNVRIRLALVNTPEVNENGYSDAKQFTETNCKVGTHAMVDEDDGQKGGSYGRMIGLVYCENLDNSLNEALMASGKSEILTEYCGISEFSSMNWASSNC